MRRIDPRHVRTTQHLARNPPETFETVEELHERRTAGIAAHGLAGYHDEEFTRDTDEETDPCAD
jgi:hypothetical protein